MRHTRIDDTVDLHVGLRHGGAGSEGCDGQRNIIFPHLEPLQKLLIN
jgi:hypothetical protein